ncbi:MAG: phosphate acyltransferase PlsX [Weeping tea tree witches'-broom phytoplasma]|uniref:phosphate acyltransferase PlsX n=1 Tax=Candidatus Phytoplasma melaleucae TaxID=2982630 RepID=UPI00293A6CBA|nr:phosphate acyltransferase PlsX [Weeping tea tree witches'-broom phytoplasma]
MIRLSVDAMGGDFAPESIIAGVFQALLKVNDLFIYLYGDANKINDILKNISGSNNYQLLSQRIKIIHTPFYLDMGIKYVREEIRDNPKHSMFLALEAARKNQVDGVISAGPTQALVLSSYLMIGTVGNMKRISLAPIFTSLDNKTRILLDAGANIETKPEDLLSFAICASVLAQDFLNISTPIVKLLNIGIEADKGRHLEIETFKLLKANPNIFFKGNEEPQNIFHTEADILLSDGYTSNILLKTHKGLTDMFGTVFKEVLTENLAKKIVSRVFFQKKIQTIFKKLDSKEIGGAILLGLNKIVIKAHGNSKSYAFYKAIMQAKLLVEQGFLAKILKKFQ